MTVCDALRMLSQDWFSSESVDYFKFCNFEFVLRINQQGICFYFKAQQNEKTDKLNYYYKLLYQVYYRCGLVRQKKMKN